MGIRTALSILLIFVIVMVGFGLVHGAICHNTDAVGASLVGGGVALALIVGAFVELDS